MEMTLLDPHPANPAYSQFSSASFIPGANELAALVTILESLARDPQVVIPSNVKQVQEFDQQTPAGQLGFLLGAFEAPSNSQFSSQLIEFVLNLWGETAASLPNQSGQPIEQYEFDKCVCRRHRPHRSLRRAALVSGERGGPQ